MVIAAIFAGIWLAFGVLAVALCVAAARGDRQAEEALTERERQIARGLGGGFRH